MHVSLCEVVGCRREATWVRIGSINCRHEEFLCHQCWHSLRDRKPVEAACYLPCIAGSDAEETAAEAFAHDFKTNTVVHIH